MEQKILHQPLELYVADMDCWHQRPLIYHFFEIVQVLEGTGRRITNRQSHNYKKGSIFLFTPADCRGFDVKETTRFCSIRFSEVFLLQCKSQAEQVRITQWLQQLGEIFSQHNRSGEILIQEPGDCALIASLIQHLITEYEQKRSHHEENMQHLITMILNILGRNVAINPLIDEQHTLINKMLIHIGQHIAAPEKLRIDHLAAQFNLSANYVSEYFSKYTGQSLQQYITTYKVKMVQQRLQHTKLPVSQIADELGFTDASHLGRVFRKYNNGMSPAEYRRHH